MSKKIKIFHIISTILVILLGTLLHFTYKLSGNNNIVALFSSVNESTWEHLKLIFFPMFLTSIIGYFTCLKTASNFWCSRAVGVFVSLSFTVVFFYTYAGILGKNIAIIDIISFFISVILGEFVSYIFMNNNFKCNKKLSILFLYLLVICFIVFTFFPPKIGLFKDPINGDFGINSKTLETKQDK